MAKNTKNPTPPEQTSEVVELKDQLAKIKERYSELNAAANSEEAEAATLQEEADEQAAMIAIGEGNAKERDRAAKAAEKARDKARQARQEAQALERSIDIISQRLAEKRAKAQERYDAACLAELSALVSEAVNATAEASKRMQAVLDFQTANPGVSVRKFKGRLTYAHLLTRMDRDGNVKGWNGAVEWIGQMRRAGWVESTPFDDISAFRHRFMPPAEKEAA